MTEVIVEQAYGDPDTVSFHNLSEGAWFINYEGYVGVKVDGKGFYPNRPNPRGLGQNGLVTPISSVRISYTT